MALSDFANATGAIKSPTAGGAPRPSPTSTKLSLSDYARSGNAQQRTTELPDPSVSSAVDAIVAQVYQGVGSPTAPAEKKGIFSRYSDFMQNTGAGIGRFEVGVAQDIGTGILETAKTAGRAIRAIPGGDRAGETGTGIGSKMIAIADKIEARYPSLDPSKRQYNSYVKQSIHEGIQAAVTSIASGAPGAVAGAALGSLAGPLGTVIGGAVGFALSGGVVFGMSQFDDSLKDMKPMITSGEVTKSEAEIHALIMGSYEGGFEFVSDLLTSLTGGTGRVLTAPAKAALENGVVSIFNKGFTAVAKNAGKIVTIETGTELATGGLETEEDYRVGITDKRFLDGVGQAFGPSFVTSLIFAGIGAKMNVQRRKQLEEALTNPEVNIEERKRAIEEVRQELERVDPTLAATWKEKAEALADNGNPIPTDITAIQSVSDIVATKGGVMPLMPMLSPAQQAIVDDVRDDIETNGKKVATEHIEQYIGSTKADATALVDMIPGIFNYQNDEVMSAVEAATQAVEGKNQAPDEGFAPEDLPFGNEDVKPTETATATESDVSLPETPSTDVADILGELSSSDKATEDWQNNHADEYGALAERLDTLEKEFKASKDKEEKAKIAEKARKIGDQLAKMETDFIGKYEEEAKQIAQQNVQDAVAEVKNKVATTPKDNSYEVGPVQEGYRRMKVSIRGVEYTVDHNPDAFSGAMHFAFHGPKNGPVTDTGYRSEYQMVKDLGMSPEEAAVQIGEMLAKEQDKDYAQKEKSAKALAKKEKGGSVKGNDRTTNNDTGSEVSGVEDTGGNETVEQGPDIGGGADTERGAGMARGKRDSGDTGARKRSGKDVSNTVLPKTITSDKEATGESDVPVKQEAAQLYVDYFNAIKDLLGDAYEVDPQYATPKGTITLSRAFNEAGAGVGGDVSVLFWKKDSQYGAYLLGSQILLATHGDTIEFGGLMYRATRKDIKYTGFSNRMADPKKVTPAEIVKDIIKEVDFYEAQENKTDDVLVTEMEKDAEARRESDGITNEEIVARVDGFTQIFPGTQEIVLTMKEASENEIALLNDYTGAGGTESKGGEGRGLLDEYYTPGELVDIVGDILTNLNVPMETVLEPSAGIGAFTYATPNAQITAFEINRTAAGVFKLNNPKARVINAPFESIFMSERGEKKPYEQEYDLVIGNPPYGEHRGKYKGMGEERDIAKYEEYFIKRALDLTKPGGHVAMVVPSSFLRNGLTKSKTKIAMRGDLIAAYRLPNNAFPTTTIGTDIVIFKQNDHLSKGTAADAQSLVDDTYFKNNPSNVLGEPSTKKGRYGMEDVVIGSIEDAQSRYFSNQGVEYAESQSANDEVQSGIVEELQDAYKPKVYKEVREEESQTPLINVKVDGSHNVSVIKYPNGRAGFVGSIPDELTHEQLATNFAERDGRASNVYESVKEANTALIGLVEAKKPSKTKAKQSAKNKEVIVKTKKTAELLDLATFSTAEADGQWEYVQPTGELAGDFDKSKAFYYKGEYFNKFNYLQGDIYEKLDTLAADASNLSPEQYEKQRTALMGVLPTLVTADRINLSPASRFAEEVKIGEKTLAVSFMEWLRKLPSSAFGESNSWAIQGYVQRQAVRGGDKLQNEAERRTRRIEGDRLFRLYITENLESTDKVRIVELYNRSFNSYVRPDYRQVPLVGKINSEFHSAPLEIRDVQLQGVGFLVNHGVGLLAHDVGIGKTMQIILAVNESIQRGWSKRPLIVVPSVSVYLQWVSEIQELIPGAKVNLLANLGGDFKGDLKTLQIEDGTISVVTEEGFKKLGFTDETYTSLTADFMDVIANPNEKKTKRQQEKEKAGAEEQMGKGVAGTTSDRSFEDLGFDLIAADEVHNANHIIPSAKPEKGQVSEYRGFSVQPSVFGVKMWLAAQYIQKMNGGRNVFLASATPFTNNPLEYYSVLSLMARERMRKMGILNVNDFMTMFMEITSQYEVRADESYSEKSEVRSFKNYQQFQKLLTEFIDFRDGEEAGVKRPERHSRIYTVGETQMAVDYKLQAQELFSAGQRKNGGTLKGIGEMRAIAFSPYLSRYHTAGIPSPTEFVKNSPKLRLVTDIIRQSLKDKPEAGHIIYSTIGVEFLPLLKQYAIDSKLVKENEIQIISGSTPKNKRAGIQEDFNSGKVKIIIGSDAIQEGINLQRNTTDLHILSLPWNFTSLRQVIGRGWRQGNRWPRMRVNSYFTENSIDIFQSQKLQNKEKRYEESLKFKGDTLDVGDINFEELKLELITDPVRRVELEYQFKQEGMEREIKRKIADSAYAQRRVADLIQARDRYNNYLKIQKENPEDHWYEGSLKSAKENLEQVIEKLKGKGIDTEDAQSELNKADAEVAALRAQIENITEDKKAAIEVAKSERSTALQVAETDFDALVRERAEDNKTFYNGGPLFERFNGAVSGSLSTRELQNVLNGLLTQEEWNAVALERLNPETMTAEERVLAKGAFNKYFTFINKPSFERALATPLIQDLTGRVTISRQYVQDFVKRPEIKKADREAALEALSEMPDAPVMNVEQFADRYAMKLLPLEPVALGTSKYEFVHLPKERQGIAENYREVIYNSPIENSAGTVHFRDNTDSETSGYFAHVRTERIENDDLEPVRRVLEVQSDLFQRGRYEDQKHTLMPMEQAVRDGRYEIMDGEGGTGQQVKIHTSTYDDGPEDYVVVSEMKLDALKRGIEEKSTRLAELEKLAPYKNTWHERIIREEIKRAAKDEVTALRFPTGATAMVIEGLGASDGWATAEDREGITQQDLSVGLEIIPDSENMGDFFEMDVEENTWIITDVLGDGKFKAMQKDWSSARDMVPSDIQKVRAFLAGEGDLSTLTKDGRARLEQASETFDISGKVDTENPIYKFYENDVQRYLRKIRPDTKLVTDEQDVTWFETQITEEDAAKPVMAFQTLDFQGYKAQATTREEARAVLEDYKKRFNLEFDVAFADTILTGEYVGTGFERGQKMQARAVTYNNKITLTENVTKTTADHEFVHLVAENIDAIPAFNGIKHMDLLRAVNGGKEFTGNDIELLNEKLAIGFEEYVAGRAQKQAQIVTRFYQILKDLLTDMLRAFGADIEVVQDFYDRLARAKGKQAVKLESSRLADSAIQRYSPTGNMVLDFGLPQLRAEFDMGPRQFFERLSEVDFGDDLNRNLLRKDINHLEDLTAQARDLYLKDPNEFASAHTYERIGETRRMKKSALDKHFSSLLDPYYKKLSVAGREKVNAVLMNGDVQGKEYDNAELRALNLDGAQIDAYKAVRKAFNIAHELLLQKMAENGVSPEEIKEYEQSRVGYMPHKWKYRYVVKTQQQVTNGSWRTTQMDNFKSERQATAAWEEMKSKNGDGSIRYTVDTLDSLEVDFFTEQRLSFEAMKTVIGQARTSDDVQKAMIDALRNMIKEKGFGRHYIKRTGVQGYETKEVPRLIADYFSGMNGYITKMEAGKAYYDTLATVDARRQSRYYNWLRDSIAYDMGGTKEWQKLKSFAFAYFLANDISFLLTNATQNFTVGMGELSKYTKGPVDAEKYLIGAMKDWATKNVTAEERSTIEALFAVGQLGGEMTAEMMGFKNNPLYNEISSKFSKVIYSATAFVEQHVNRAPAFLAARRMLMAQGMNETEANEKALEISDDIHFRYGKHHRPRFERGRASVLFVFYHYMRSFLYQLSRDLTQREYAAFTRKMLYTAVLGGTISLPFGATLVTLFRLIFGAGCTAGKDGTCAMEQEMAWWQIALEKGLPALTGVDLSGRVGIDLFAIGSIAEDPHDIKNYLGAVGSLFWANLLHPISDAQNGGRIDQGIALLFQNRYDDAMAKLLPDMFANPIKGYTGYNWGVRSFAGTPLQDSNGETLKYSPWEAVIRATGFTPTRESLAWDAKKRQFIAEDKKSSSSANVSRTILGQLQRGDYEGARQTQVDAVASGAISGDTDYIVKLGKETFLKTAVETYKNGDGSVATIERKLIEDVYGGKATDLQKNNIRKSFAVYRTFGFNNKFANKVLGAGSNAEKIDILKEAKATMDPDEFSAFMRAGRKTVTTEAGNDSYILISDDLYDQWNISKNKP